MCLHHGNINEIEEMANFAISIGAGSLKFNPVTNAGRGSNMHDNGETLNYDETMKLTRYVHGDFQKKTKIKLILSAPLALLTVDNILHNCGKGMCNVRHIMGILGTGHMALCGIGRNIPELCYGELGVDSLRDIWINHPLLAEIRRKLDGDYPGICADCIHAYSCRTGCLAMNYMKDGELFSPSILCEEADRRGEFPVTRRRNP
jgi:radical SAM protein with 4Fe4S-binding SPASM domain